LIIKARHGGADYLFSLLNESCPQEDDTQSSCS
jgi:hypothetical protein